MTTSYRKKLIEVALPLEAINREAAREKSIRHGHPSTLHLWWARRPLAACRAVLFASLVDDPDSDPRFDAYGPVEREHAVGERRAELFDLIEELVKWENTNNSKIINRARAEIASSVASRKIELGELDKATVVFAPDGTGLKEGDEHPNGPLAEDGTTAYRVSLRQAKPDIVNHFLANYASPVLDPFAGGGSIPLEAQRLGLRAHASDLNPVAVLINKAQIEFPPKFAGMPPVYPRATQRTNWSGAQGIAEDVRCYGKWMRDEAKARIGKLYPTVRISEQMAAEQPELRGYTGRELTVIAWLCARTVASPNPATGGAHVPLLRQFWLSKRKGKEAWLQPIVDRNAMCISFRVRRGLPDKGLDPAMGTVSRKGARCLLTDTPIPLSYVRTEARAGRMRECSIGVVAEGDRERVYVAYTTQGTAVRPEDVTWKPDLIMPSKHRDIHPPGYGMSSFGDIFTSRQLTALNTFCGLLDEVRALVRDQSRGHADPDAYADIITLFLAFAVSKAANYWSTSCAWHTSRDIIVSTFGRPGIPMVWDFAEANPFSSSTGNFEAGVIQVAKVIERLPSSGFGLAIQRDAARDEMLCNNAVISTDPPYYDNIAYAELSDFFYVWLRRALSRTWSDLFSTMETPKAPEITGYAHRFDGDRDKACRFFESRLGEAFSRMKAAQDSSTPLTVFYAFKQSEGSGTTSDSRGQGTYSTGWETMLEGLIGAGYMISGTWPVRTELVSNLKKNMSVLASSIVLVCRARYEEAPLATRKEFLDVLRRQLPPALRAMQSGNVAPVDLAQASIGPGMECYSRYNRVVNADGTPMSVREALQLINQVLDEVLTEQESDFDADTRFALKWFEQYAQKEGPFGDAETLAKAMAVSVNGVVESGIAQGAGGKVRLLKREEMDASWDPQTDTRLTIWEVTQHLIRNLEQDGEQGAADLLRRVGFGAGEIARELAYRLYQTCERKKWADEARSYNGLVVSWPEIQRLAREQRREPAPAEATLFDNE